MNRATVAIEQSAKMLPFQVNLLATHQPEYTS